MRPTYCTKKKPCDYDEKTAYCLHRECRKAQAEAVEILASLSARYLANPDEPFLDEENQHMKCHAFVATITDSGQDSTLFKLWRRAYDLTHPEIL